MASSRRPPLSLPPELGAIEDLWNEDEEPTVSRTSRIPTCPASLDIPEEPPTTPALAIDLAEEGEDLQERVTTIPDVPPDEYARQVMASERQDSRPHQSMGSSIQDRSSALSEPSGISLSRDAPSLSEEDDDSLEFNLPPNSNAPAGLGEFPMAPPPQSFGREGDPIIRGSAYVSDRAFPRSPPSKEEFPQKADQLLSLPPGVSPPGAYLDPGSQPTARPPPLAPMSEPRVDIRNFSGRFSSAPPHEVNDEQAMRDKFAMGDFSGALELAERLLLASPLHTEASSLASKCREVLEDMYASRIADMQRTPVIAMGPDQIRWLSLDHRAGFLLSMIDGISTMDDLLDVSGMPRLDALRILCALLERKVIKLG